MDENKWRSTVEAAGRGDEKAFEALYRETERSVYFTCLKLLKNEDNAKDIMQDTYMTAIRKLPQLEDGAKFAEWINRIAINKCKDLFRKATDDSLDEMTDMGFDPKDDENLIPEDYVTDDVKRQVVMDIINNVLSEIQRQTVILYYYDRLTLEEIAEVMGCPMKTVSSRLVAAREKIREAVLIYEKANDDRLHVIVPVPILTRILRMEAQKISVPDIPLSTFAKLLTDTSAAASATTVTTTIAGGSTKMGLLTGKVIAGITAGIIATGGITAAVVLGNKDSGTGNSVAVSEKEDTKAETEKKTAEEKPENSKEETNTETNETDESIKTESEAETEEHKDLFFIWGDGQLDKMKVLRPQDNISGDLIQKGSDGIWEEYYYPQSENMNRNVTTVMYEPGTFMIKKDEKPEGQSELEYARDKFASEEILRDFFPRHIFGGDDPSAIEIEYEEVVPVPDVEGDALKFKGYMYWTSYYDGIDNKSYEDLRYYCEGYIGFYDKHHNQDWEFEEDHYSCYAVLTWTQEDTEENREKVGILTDESLKSIAYLE